MVPGPNEKTAQCHHCSSSDLSVAAGYAQTGRVTSDCKPWPPGGILAFCQQCGLVQTVANEAWQKESEQIYSGYTIYHQSGGVEQATFDAASGAGQVRSDAIVKALLTHHAALQASGRWLDIGCGNGALLRACSRALPRWTLCGSEVSNKYQTIVEGIPGVERLFTGRIESIPGTFDVISLIHVIEHIAAPQLFLRNLMAKLKPEGVLLLEVPDCRQNFFSLMTADHCSHFSAGMLAKVVAVAGFEVLHAVDTWIAKEVTVVARPFRSPDAPMPPVPMRESEEVFGGWQSLQRVLSEAKALAKSGPFGIFGTSIAAIWLDAQLGQATRFFVDEDESRTGKQYFGRPIVSPTEIPEDAKVYVALPPAVAARVVQRLQALKPNVRFTSP